MIVAQVRPDQSFEIIDREKEMVRLGAGGLDGRALTPAAMAAGARGAVQVPAAGRLAQGRRDHRGGDQRHPRGGERRRLPRRGPRAQTGIDVRVISGHRRSAADSPSPPPTAIDSASATAWSSTSAAAASRSRSAPRAHPALARSFKARRDPPHRAVRPRPTRSPGATSGGWSKHIASAIGPHVEQIVGRGYQRVIGTSGTILSLGCVALAAESGHVPDDLRNRRVPAKSIRRLRKALVASDQRRAPADAGAGSAARRPRRGRRGADRHHPPPPRRRRDLRSARWRCAKG